MNPSIVKFIVKEILTCNRILFTHLQYQKQPTQMKGLFFYDLSNHKCIDQE